MQELSQLPAGYEVSYEAEVTGGWFADIRDANGRRTQTGLGRTREEALAHALQRLGGHVRITVTGDCGHVLGTYTDTITEKYPFWCGECGTEKRLRKYPWTLTTEIVTGEESRDSSATPDSKVADRPPLNERRVTDEDGEEEEYTLADMIDSVNDNTSAVEGLATAVRGLVQRVIVVEAAFNAGAEAARMSQTTDQTTDR